MCQSIGGDEELWEIGSPLPDLHLDGEQGQKEPFGKENGDWMVTATSVKS